MKRSKHSISFFIKNAMAINEISMKEMLKRLSCSHRTFAQRMAHPETLRLSELIIIAETIMIPLSEIIEKTIEDKN